VSLKNHYRSICFNVQEQIEGLFFAEWAAINQDYNCIADEPTCRVVRMDRTGTIGSDGFSAKIGGRKIPWRDLCRDTSEPGKAYLTTDEKITNEYFVNVTKEELDPIVDKELKNVTTYKGNHFVTTFASVNAHAMILDVFVRYDAKIVKTPRGTMKGPKEIKINGVNHLLPCFNKPTGNFTIGHIVGLILAGMDDYTNCAWERSVINGLKSSEIETVFKDPIEYSYRVLEIATTDAGTPYPRRFIHTVKTKTETCFFHFNQDAAEPADQLRKSCSVTSVTLYNAGYAITQYIENAIGHMVRVCTVYVHAYMPEFISCAWDWLIEKEMSALTFVAERSGDIYGWMCGKLTNFKRMITDGREVVDTFIHKFQHEFPKQTEEFYSTLRLAITKFNAGEDSKIIFTFEDPESIEHFQDFLETNFDKYFKTPIIVGESFTYDTKSFGKQTIITICGRFDDTQVRKIVKFMESVELDTALLATATTIRKPCKEQQNCTYGSCPKNACPKTYEAYLTGYPTCSQKRGCYVLPVQIQGDRFEIFEGKDDQKVIKLEGDDNATTEESEDNEEEDLEDGEHYFDDGEGGRSKTCKVGDCPTNSAIKRSLNFYWPHL